MWASARAGDDSDFDADAEFFDLPESWRKSSAPREFIINHDGWVAFEVFCACATQWTHSIVGQRTGLNYQAITCVARDWFGLETNRDLLEQIHCLEIGALAATHGKTLQSVIDG